VDPLTTLFTLAGGCLTTLTLVVGYLSKWIASEITDLKRRSQDCEDDRTQLWERFAEINTKPRGN
jgi:hypothetical protein